MSMWSFTCRSCSKTQVAEVGAATRRVKCVACEASRDVPAIERERARGGDAAAADDE